MTENVLNSNSLIKTVFAQFTNENNELLGVQFELPLDTSREKLEILFNVLFNKNQDPLPYSFYINDCEINCTIKDLILFYFKNFNFEKVVKIKCIPQASYRVESVTYCSSSSSNHSKPILTVAYNNDGSKLASGSGDTTVKFWDTQTQLLEFNCEAHKSWVLCISWSPDGKKLASGCKMGLIYIWNSNNGEKIKKLKGHSKWINSLAWEPFHRNTECRRLASASKDFTIKIWDTILGNLLYTLTSHTMSVTCLKWGGIGLIYTSSQDQEIKIWNDKDGSLLNTLGKHAHWVNNLALSTDYVLRLGSFDPKTKKLCDTESEKSYLLKKFQEYKGQGERLVSCSDDFTLKLWLPENNKLISRMVGHSKLVNDVKFSLDGRLIASASFDKSVIIWNGNTGKGHVNFIYQVSWSSDSRLLVSASADSTLKVWNIKTGEILNNLSGHSDEVYAVDWSPNGEYVASGGKDKVLKIWRK